MDAEEKTRMWSFFSPCTTPTKGCTIFVNDLCNQYKVNSIIGTQMPVNPVVNTGYASLPLHAVGKQRGNIFKKMWASVFKENPQHVLISNWNEGVATGPFKVHEAGDANVDARNYFKNTFPEIGNNEGNFKYIKSMGFEDSVSGDFLFVDSYGDEYARDVEPNIYEGDKYYQIMKSCVSMYKNNQTCQSHPQNSCCHLDATGKVNFIWALRRNDENDFILTSSVEEKNHLAQNGWTVNCSLWGGDPEICKTIDSYATSAPFFLYEHHDTNRVALMRCVAGDKHFFSTDSQCEGQKVEAPLGYLSLAKTSENPRAFYRCYDAARGVHRHSIGFKCPAGLQEVILGYAK